MKNIGIGTIKYPQGKNLSETRGKLIGIGEVIYDGKRYFVHSKGTGVTPGPEPGMKKNTFRFKLNAPPGNFREVDSFGNMWKVVDADEHIYDVTLKLDENKKGEGLIYWGYNGPNYTATLIDVGDISEIKGFSYIAGAVFPANYCQLNFDVVPDYSNIEDFSMMFVGLKNTEFPAMDISNGKYFEGMFGATHITAAPEFIALPSDPRSFRGMFQKCEDMTTAPTELLNFPQGPDTVSYNDMFWNATKLQSQINYVYGGGNSYRTQWAWDDGIYSLENSVVIRGQMPLTQRSNLAIKNNGGDLMQFHDYEFTNDFNPMRCNDHEGGQFTWALQQREDTELKVIIVSKSQDEHRSINLSGDWTENITEIEYDNSYSTFYDTLYFGKALISAENIEQIYESIKDLLNFEVIDVSVSPFRDCPNVVDAAIPTEWGGKGMGAELTPIYLTPGNMYTNWRAFAESYYREYPDMYISDNPWAADARDAGMTKTFDVSAYQGGAMYLEFDEPQTSVTIIVRSDYGFNSDFYISYYDNWPSYGGGTIYTSELITNLGSRDYNWATTVTLQFNEPTTHCYIAAVPILPDGSYARSAYWTLGMKAMD